MALNLGDLVVNLDANTKGIKDAQREMRTFAESIDSVVFKTDKLKRASLTAAVRQEKAISNASVAYHNMGSAISRAGAQGQVSMNGLKMATERHNAIMRGGAVNALTFARAQTQLKVETTKVANAFKTFRAREAGKGLANMQEHIRNLSSASVLAIGPLSGLGARIGALGSIAGRGTIKLALLFGAITGTGVAVAALIRSVITANLELEAVNARLIAAAGSTQGAAKEFRFIVKESRRLGTSIKAAAGEYAGFLTVAKRTGLTVEDSRKLFSGVATAAAALRLNTDQTTGAFRAFQQMLSKGKVQAEELRGQLAERIPGAFVLAADAMGVTIQALDKLIKRGEVAASDLLPKLADVLIRTFGPAATRAAKSLQGSINNLGNSWLLLRKQIDDTLAPSAAAASSLRTLSSVLDFMGDNLNGLFKTLALVAGAFSGLIAFSLLRRIGTFIILLNTVRKSLMGVSVAMTAIPGVGLAAFFGRLALSIGGAVAALMVMDEALDATKAQEIAYKESIDSTTAALLQQNKTQLDVARAQLADVRFRIADAEEQMRKLHRIITGEVGGGITLPKPLGKGQTLGADVLKSMEIPQAVFTKYDELGTLVKTLTPVMDGLAGAIRGIEAAQNELGGATAGVAKMMSPLIELANAERFSLEVLGIVSRGLAGSFEEVNKELVPLNREAKDFGFAILGVSENLLPYIDFIRSSEEALRKKRSTLVPLNREAKDFGFAVLGASENLLPYIESLRDAKIAQEEAIASVRLLKGSAEEMGFAILGAAENTSALRDHLRTLREKELIETRQVIQSVGMTFNSAFEESIIQGEKFRDVLQGIREDLMRLAIRKGITEPAVAGLLAFAAPQATASGGFRSANTPIMVGEQGPEIFVPGTSGRVMSNGQSQGMGGGNIYIDARGADPGSEHRLAIIARRIENQAVQRAVRTVSDGRARGRRA